MHCIIKTHRQKAWDDGVAPSVYTISQILEGLPHPPKQAVKNEAVQVCNSGHQISFTGYLPFIEHLWGGWG